MWTENFQMFKLDLEKAKEAGIKFPTSVESSKKQERSRETSTSASLTTLKPLTVWITTNWKILAAAAAKLLQSCPTLCDLIDGSPPGSLVPGILQARTLEWVAISFNAWKWKVNVKSLSHVRLFATPWTAANQAPPSMGFSRQEHWSGVPSPSPISAVRWH